VEFPLPCSERLLVREDEFGRYALAHNIIHMYSILFYSMLSLVLDINFDKSKLSL
jgi:hypothetical protein